MRKASAAIQQKQSAISSLVQRINVDGSGAAASSAAGAGTPPRPLQLHGKPAWQGWQGPSTDVAKTPAKKWPTVTAGGVDSRSASATNHTRVMARHDTVTNTLYGMGSQGLVKATSSSQFFRGGADVWGDEVQEQGEEVRQHV